jgi:hypothetical protein
LESAVIAKIKDNKPAGEPRNRNKADRLVDKYVPIPCKIRVKNMKIQARTANARNTLKSKQLGTSSVNGNGPSTSEALQSEERLAQSSKQSPSPKQRFSQKVKSPKCTVEPEVLSL